MKIIGLLSWFDESPTWLAATVASMSRVCDHVVALDGRYAHYSDERYQSSSEQVSAVMEAARASGMGLTLHTAPKVWETEMDKRTHLFRLGALEAETFEDWFFVLDADEVLIHVGDYVLPELKRLRSEQKNVAVARLLEELDPHADEARSKLSRNMELQYIYTSPTPRFYRALKDIRVTECHYYYTGEDERGMRVALWGQQRTDTQTGETIVVGEDHAASEPGLTPWHMFGDSDVLIENRCCLRAKTRFNRREEYYQTRDQLGIELQTGRAKGQEAVA